jgi:tRNA G18 (ribose-2'-O)-methylase SpoU
MPEFIEINDLNAPGCEVFTKLTEAQLRNRLEPEKGIFIAESPKVIDLAISAGYELVSILTEKRCLEGCASGIIQRCGDIPVYLAPPEVLSQMTGYKLNRGVLCAVRRPKPRSAEEICRNAHRVAVLENIVDSTNIGAAFRSAAALGIDAVLVTPSCCDPLLRRSVRVSMGTVLLVPWAVIGEESSDWPGKGIEQLHSWGFRTAAMALSDRSVSIDDPALAAEDKLAIILGTEGDGLSSSTIASCDYTVKIPMSLGVDSLNVAAAGAVAFWELRWRGER